MHKYMIKRWICVENKKMRQQMETLVCDVSPFWSSRTVGTAPGHAAWLNNWRKRSSACWGSSLVGLTVSCVDYLNRLSQSFFLKRKADVAGWWRYVLFINGASANQTSSPSRRPSTYSIWQASRSHLQPVMEGSADDGFEGSASNWTLSRSRKPTLSFGAVLSVRVQNNI